jgi:hypothetical protein
MSEVCREIASYADDAGLRPGWRRRRKHLSVPGRSHALDAAISRRGGRTQKLGNFPAPCRSAQGGVPTGLEPLRSYWIGAAADWTGAATATVSNRRILRRIPFDRGPIASLASSLDGATPYCAASGAVWSVPSGGGAPRGRFAPAIRPRWDLTDRHCWCILRSRAAGPRSPGSRLFEAPLTGPAEREIPLNGPLNLAFDPATSSAIVGQPIAVAPATARNATHSSASHPE